MMLRVSIVSRDLVNKKEKMLDGNTIDAPTSINVQIGKQSNVLLPLRPYSIIVLLFFRRVCALGNFFFHRHFDQRFPLYGRRHDYTASEHHIFFG
jgi:hypothetical protein